MDKCIDDEIYMVRNLLTRSVDHNFVFHIFLGRGKGGKRGEKTEDGKEGRKIERWWVASYE